MKCLMVRGVLSGWSGAHNPAYTEAQIAAGTEPTSAWALTAFAGICRGYALGYGAVYMNDGDADSFLGWMNYSGNVDCVLMRHLERMLNVASDFSRGTKFLALTDTVTDDQSPFNSANGSESWGQLLDYLSKSFTISRTTMKGLESGELNYSSDKSYFNQFRGIILLLQGDGTGVSDAFAATLSSAISNGVPFVVLQRDAINGAQSFNKIFAPLALANASSTWAHFDATSVSYNLSELGAEESLTEVTLSTHPLFYTGAASFALTNAKLVGTELDGYTGAWYFCTCSEEPVLDEPDAVNGIVESTTGHFGADQLFTHTFDVSATIIKPDDWRSTLPEGALKFDWWGNWDEPTRSNRLVTVQSAGLMYSGGASTVQKALFTYEGVKYGGSRNFNILVINRITGRVVDHRTFDVFDTTKPDAVECAEFLNALTNEVAVFIATWDEPQTNAAAIKSALLRCGASQTTLNGLVYRSAYILAGIPGIGAENGIERYAGDISSDPKSYVTEVFDLKLNAAPVLTPVMSDASGYPHMASLSGHMDNVVLALNVVQFLNSGLETPLMKQFVRNVIESLDLASKPRSILIATDKIAGTYSITDESATGMSNLIELIKSFGYTVDVHDIRSYPMAEPSWFSDYCAMVLICLDSTYTKRMEPYVDSMMLAVRRGIGLFCIGDGHDMSRNMDYLLRHYDLTSTTQNTFNPSAFNVDAQYAKHGSPLLNGLSVLGSNFPNDLNYGGTLSQCLGYVPVAVSTEKLEIYSYNNLKRTARIRYRKKLDRFDSLRQFKVQGFAKLTDVRFKKLDMSGSDDFWIHLGFPSVEAMDQPDITIGDAAVTENDGSYIFSSRWLDKIVSAIETDPNGKSYATNSIINTPSPAGDWTQVLKTFGVSGSSQTWNKRRYSWVVTYRVYVPAAGTYLTRFSADDVGSWWLDDSPIVVNHADWKSHVEVAVDIPSGWHEIRIAWSQTGNKDDWTHNPEACALAIHSSFAGGYGAYTDVIAQVPVRLSDPVAVSRPITVDYTTVDGTAVAGKDYVATSGTLTFEQGESLKTISVPIIGDSVVESDEAFTVRLSNSSRGSIVRSDGTVSIADNDVGVCSDSWWVPSIQDGILNSKCSRWGPDTTVVIYVLGYYMENGAWRPYDYNRIVLDWRADGQQTYWSDLNYGVVGSVSIAQAANKRMLIKAVPTGLDFYHGEMGDVEDDNQLYANYVFAYVHDYEAINEKAQFINMSSTGQSDGVAMGGHAFLRGPYRPYSGSDGVGATESGENNFLGSPKVIAQNALYKVADEFYVSYVCVPTIPPVSGVTIYGFADQLPPSYATTQGLYGMRKIDNPDGWGQTAQDIPILFTMIRPFGDNGAHLHTKGAVSLLKSEVGF